MRGGIEMTELTAKQTDTLNKACELEAINAMAQLFKPLPLTEIFMKGRNKTVVLREHKDYWNKETKKVKTWINNNL